MGTDQGLDELERGRNAFRHFRSVRLDVPVLHLNGAEDPLTIGVARNFPKYTSAMTMQLIPGCGHFIAEERPEELLDRLTSFFAPAVPSRARATARRAPAARPTGAGA